MKKRIVAMLGALALMLSMVGAAASVRAVPNQSLGLRTGPNTRYAWLSTMPESTDIAAYEYEEGNDVTWVLVEYTYRGEVYRGYTGLKRMTVLGSVPWASHLYIGAWANRDCSVLAAPTSRGAWRADLAESDYVTVLDYENGYAYVEFYDRLEEADSRGYVFADWLDEDDGYEYEAPMYDGYGGEYDDWNGRLQGVEAVPNQKLALRGCPLRQSVWLGHMPQSTEITAYEYEKGNGVTWVLVEYMKDGLWERGYTGLKRMTVCGYIPWADHFYDTVYAARRCTVYAAPYTNGAVRGSLYDGEQVTLLEYDGDYAFIEYYDAGEACNSRGYVRAEELED